MPRFCVANDSQNQFLFEGNAPIGTFRQRDSKWIMILLADST